MRYAVPLLLSSFAPCNEKHFRDMKKSLKKEKELPNVLGKRD
jgi:hypothetical protein